MNEAKSMMGSFSGMGAGTIVTLCCSGRSCGRWRSRMTIIKRYIPK